MEKIVLKISEDIKLNYLVFYSEYCQTGITAYRKKYYTLNNLKDDVRRNMVILFGIDDNEFNLIWENFMDIFKKFEFDPLEIINDENLSKLLISKNQVTFQNFLIKNIKHMSTQNKQALWLYLNKFYSKEIYLFDISKFTKLYHLIFGDQLNESISNILIKSGIGLETLWISSTGNNLGLHLNKITFPIDMITLVKNSSLVEIMYPSFKKSFKSFKKRFNYKKNRSYYTQCVGIDLLFSGFDQIENGLKLIDPLGTTRFLAHPNIIDKNVFNPFVKENLWEFTLEAAKSIQLHYSWINQIFETLSNFNFLEDSTDFYKVYSHEIENQEYHVIISCWYRYSLPIEQNSILILLYHPNIRSLINKIYDSGIMKCIIGITEDEDIILIGEERIESIINLVENAFKEKNYSVKKKVLSKNEINEKSQTPLEIEPDIQKKILDLLEKHDTDINEKLRHINDQLKEKLGSDYQKLKEIHQRYKNKEITKRKYITFVGKIIGKHTLSILGIFF